MADAEVIVVCIDNSKEMYFSDNYQAQFDAIRDYCKAKLNAHPETEVGLFLMGADPFAFLLYPPTRDLQRILDCLPSIRYCCPKDLWFSEAVRASPNGFGHPCPNKKKRILYFVGGPIDLNRSRAYSHGVKLKDEGIAVEVVKFYLEDKNKRWGRHQFGRVELDTFVAAADFKGNSHIIHVEPGHSVCEVLSKSNLLKNTPADPDWKGIINSIEPVEPIYEVPYTFNMQTKRYIEHDELERLIREDPSRFNLFEKPPAPNYLRGKRHIHVERGSVRTGVRWKPSLNETLQEEKTS